MMYVRRVSLSTEDRSGRTNDKRTRKSYYNVIHCKQEPEQGPDPGTGEYSLTRVRFQCILLKGAFHATMVDSLNHNVSGGFPGGAVVENPPANAGDTGSSPGLGRSHMPRSNQAHEPQLLSLRVWSLCSATREAAIVRGPHTAVKSGPRSPQLEKALAQKRRPSTAINK